MEALVNAELGPDLALPARIHDVAFWSPLGDASKSGCSSPRKLARLNRAAWPLGVDSIHFSESTRLEEEPGLVAHAPGRGSMQFSFVVHY
jgi:hypothetical protein